MKVNENEESKHFKQFHPKPKSQENRLYKKINKEV